MLIQLVKGKRYRSQYESKIRSNTEKKYNATKWKCYGILKALKRAWYWLYRVRFILDIKQLV